jgi:hypothetical protein
VTDKEFIDKISKVDDLVEAVTLFIENSEFVGTDPYYSDLNDALWNMLQGALNAHVRKTDDKSSSPTG